MVGMHSVTTGDPLEDETCRRILLITSRNELTAPAIAYALDLPLAECYRRISDLFRSGYLTIAGYRINARKRAHKIYRAKLDGIEVFYHRDRVMMRVPRRGPGVEGVKLEIVVPSGRRLKRD
jgi:hypothetical protein